MSTFKKIKELNICHTTGLLKQIDNSLLTNPTAFTNWHILCLCNGDLNFVDLKDRIIAHQIKSPEDPIKTFDYKENLLVTACASGLVKFWNMENLKLIKKIGVKLVDVIFVEIHHSLKLSAFCDARNIVNIIAVPEGYITHRVGFKQMISCIKFPKSVPEALFCGANNGSVFSYNLKTRKQKDFKNHYSAVTQIDFSPGGKKFISASRDKVMTLWNLINEENSESKNYKVGKTWLVNESIETITVKYDKINNDKPNQILIGGNSGQILFFDATKGKIYQKSQKLTTLRILQTFYANFDLKIDFFDQNNKNNENKSKLDQKSNFNDHFYVLTEDGRLNFLKGKEKLKTLPLRFEPIEEFLPLPPSTDSNVALVVDDSPQPKLINLSNFNTEVLFGNNGAITSAAVSSDGEIIVCGSNNGELSVFQINNLLNFGKENKIYDFQNSENNFENIKNFDFSLKGIKIDAHLKKIVSVAISENKEFIVSAGVDFAVCVWKYEKEIILFKKINIGSVPLNALEIGQNDSFLCYGLMNGQLKLKHFPSLTDFGALVGHNKAVWQIKFSKTERFLLSCSSDKTIRLWSLKSLNCVQTFEAHEKSVHGVSFSPNGDFFVSFDLNGKINFWETNDPKGICNKNVTFNSIKNLKSLEFAGEKKCFCSDGNCLTIWQKEKLENSQKENINSNLKIKEDYFRKIAVGNRKEAFLNGLEVDSIKFHEKLFIEFEKELSNNEIKLEKISEKTLSRILLNITIWSENTKTATLAQKVLNWLLNQISLKDIASCDDFKYFNLIKSLTLKKQKRVLGLKTKAKFLEIFDEIL